MDDLTKIEGIGPKISGILTAAGILTFAELSTTSQAELNRILQASDLKGSYGDPTTWPAQAELAAAGEWEALESMQAGLKGGRIE
jgi:predicted flap endonuclease-1-like 5' DNA nuclease